MSASSCLRQRGIATVEFAICVPVLLLLMLATAEVGRMLIQYNTLSKAVRDGARYTARDAANGSTGTVLITAAIRNSTRNLVVTGNMAGTGAPLLPGLTVANVTVTNAGAGFIAVSATYTYQPMLGAALPTFGPRGAINTNIPLTSTVVMRALL
ncbi:MAG TPA: TadE family protein [Steroidobacteraceae bacterium]|nr:TadE family protein [Steroidobacteraceae bacterium]